MARVHENAAATEAVATLVFPFTRGGYRHVLLARAGRVCLVERTSTRRDNRGSVHYEVIVVQVERAKTWPDGRVTPARETFPKPAVWGSAGWTYPTHAAAARRFQAVVLARDGLAAGIPPNSPPHVSHANPTARGPAKGYAGTKFGHSRRDPDPVARPPRVDARLGVCRRPVAIVADCPMGATVQLADGAWVRIVERTPCLVTIEGSGGGRREVAPAAEVFAQRPMLAGGAEVAGA